MKEELFVLLKVILFTSTDENRVLVISNYELFALHF